MRRLGREDVDAVPWGWHTAGFHCALATEHYLSAQAGMEVFKQGGNAFDAAAAAALAESVVNPHMFTLGGECPMLLYLANENKVVSVNGNTQAPWEATLEAYLNRRLQFIPPEGVLAAGVPAAFSALAEMLIRYGALPFSAIVNPAYVLARDGFPAHSGLIQMPGFSITANREKFIDLWPSSAQLYLHSNLAVPSVGDRMQNPALADLFRCLMDSAEKAEASGREAGFQSALEQFYRGDIAREIDSFVSARGGYLSRVDLEKFETLFEEPVTSKFRDTTVFKCGPWSQGPVMLQLLRLLEGFELEKLRHNSADYLHRWIEAAKLAYADREQYYADPRFTPAPLPQLLSRSYNDLRRQLIDPLQASGLHRPGDPANVAPLLPVDKVFRWDSWGFGTVHVAVVDQQGNMAALTPSGAWISSNEVIPALGFPLTSRLQTFYLDPGHPNALAPGKRPRTTLTPTLAFRNGKPWMAFGTMGGDQQDQWLSQFFLNRVVFKMSLQEAIEAPKITFDHTPSTFYPHEAFPRRVRLEDRIAAEVAADLASRGHKVEMDSAWAAGFICAVERQESGLLQAGADPRGRKASVFPACALSW
jgi:gamma-glutamyltranspeptidase / glutathione hydrolase